MGERWKADVEQHFDFLAAAGFTTVVVADGQWWETSVTYLAERVGIKVADSREYSRVEVELLRLVDGQAPPVQVWVTEERIDEVLLDNVVEARGPKRLRELTRGRGLLRSDVHRQLAAAATILREVAPEFLTGDASAIDDGAEVVRARVRKRPQTLTLRLPASATDEEAAAELAALTATTPHEVRLQVRRYGLIPRARRRRGGR